MAPVKIATYTDTLEIGFGCYSLSFAHSARFAQQGRRLYVSYWDAGTIELDISNPANPVFVNRTQLLLDEDRDNHSMTEVGGRWLIINPEDTSPNVCGPISGGWGGASVFDAEANVAVAAWTVEHSGWGSWPVAEACGA